MHRAALFVEVGRLNKAAPKGLVWFGISLAHFSPLSSLVGTGGVSYIGGLLLRFPSWSRWPQLWWVYYTSLMSVSMRLRVMLHTQRPQIVFAGWRVELMCPENQFSCVCLSAALLLWRPWYRAAAVAEQLWLDITASFLLLLALGAFCCIFSPVCM